ncbi:phospholipase YtpA [Oerskovia enterophila]|uniref:Phospholipase YtpA n=1 Tax=Oerskovia enterophila TaxID=43678 RepID=A0A163T8K2_9CELL|nr:phospholipase YtpA [Oerskovia enterophila]
MSDEAGGDGGSGGGPSATSGGGTPAEGRAVSGRAVSGRPASGSAGDQAWTGSPRIAAVRRRTRAVSSRTVSLGALRQAAEVVASPPAPLAGRGGAAARKPRFRPQRGRWQEDVLGPDYRQLTLQLTPDDEGEVVATLVRYDPPTEEAVRPARAVLYVHGWSDYFFQTELAEYWHGQGAAFYAVDLRKYGRSLRPHQTPGYMEHLSEYDEDLETALATIHAELGAHAAVMLLGHSTGGLTGVLWANRNPGRLRGLVLNSPWLELQGSSTVRTVSAPAIRQLARFQPKAPLPNIDAGYYARTLRDLESGGWEFNPEWRPVPSFPVRAGWLRGIIEGHATVAAGLAVSCPIIVLTSDRTIISPRWSEDMRQADIVLDVELLARRAPHLGPVVTIARIAGGIHDLTLSGPAPRAHFYREITRWLAGYGWS